MNHPHRSVHEKSGQLSMHRHREPYAALVLEGSHVEMSPDGRFTCVPGVLMVHPAWHAHANEFGADGAVVLNLPAPGADGVSAVSVPDPQGIEILARKNPLKAALAAMEEVDSLPPVSPATWLARLVNLLARDPHAPIADLAKRCGVSAEHASRACKRWFGLGPASLRRERRLQHAMDLLHAGASPVEAALGAGFSDQPHLTRLLKAATGITPARLAHH